MIKTVSLTFALAMCLASFGCDRSSHEEAELKLAPLGTSVELLIEALSERGVPSSQIKLGSFPFIHSQAKQGLILPLLSAPCPPGLSPPQAIQSLTPALLRAGFELTEATRSWRPGRPIFSGLSREGSPVLAIRLSPAAPRLSVIMSPPPSSEVPPRLLRRLPEHLTFALDLNAPNALATYDYLSNAGRELALISPDAQWREHGFAQPPQEEVSPDLAARWRDQLLLLEQRAHLSALRLPARALSYQGLTHLEALADELRRLRVTLIEPPSGLPELSRAVVRARGGQLIRVSHELSVAKERLQEELKAVEAALVLEGEATLWVPPLTRGAWQVFTAWLTELTVQKGVLLMRSSELAL